MSTIVQDLNTLQDARDDMKTALENKGMTVTNDIRTYANAIANIPSGSGSGDVKLFDTVEHMQADPSPSEGDLAVVYREELVPIDGNTKFDSCVFPKIVILDGAFTDNIFGGFRNIGSGHFEGMVEVSSSSFSFSGYGGSGNINVQYTSSDGITYTRTDGGEELVEFGITIKWEDYGEPFNDVIGNFMKMGGSVFKGLYNCKEVEKINTDLFKGFMANPEETEFTDIYVKNLNVDYSAILNEIGEPYNDYVKHGAGLITEYETLDNIDGRVVIKPKVYYKLWRFQNNIQAPNFFLDNNKYYFASYNGGNFGSSSKSYLLKYDNGTITLKMLDVSDFVRSTINGSYWVYGGVSTEKCILFFDDYYFNNSYDTGIVNNPSAIYLYNPNKENELFKTYNELDYLLAPTQLNATPDYVYEKTFYGKNGVENGTLTTSVSTAFNDVSAEIYAKIQNVYDDMTPLVASNNRKMAGLGTDIKSIPSKTDGTPLLDTSNVTDMNGMFAYCKSLTTISLLDTSNVTNMGYMFISCSNLTSIPLLDTSNVTDMDSMFYNCSSLTTIPLLDTSNVTKMVNMFYNCSSLNNESLNNILAMCTNAAKITSNKTLNYIGLTEEQANICKTLSNYSAFIAAGWTTGY